MKGYWEPAIERFTIKMHDSSLGNVYSKSVELPEPLNINISVNLGAVIHEFMKRWEDSAEEAEVFQKLMEEQLLYHHTVTSTNILEEIENKKNNKKQNNNLMLMDMEDEALVDSVTPYAIRNLTAGKITVSSLSDNVDNPRSVYEIEQGEVKGLAVSFSDTLGMAEQEVDGRKKVVQKDLFLKVNFGVPGTNPLPRFKLN